MSIIRSQVNQDYTLVINSVTEDKEFQSKYLGTFVRLISKGRGWEISADGLAVLYPTEKRDFYRSALKHMCKLGYLVRIPQDRIKGRFTKSIMELYDKRQINTPLSDETVDLLFSNEDIDQETIQKIYPQRIIQHGTTNAVDPTKESIKEESIKEENNNKEKEASPVVVPSSNKDLTYPCLNELPFDQAFKKKIGWMKNKEGNLYTQEEILRAVNVTKASDYESLEAFFTDVLKNPGKYKEKERKSGNLKENKKIGERIRQLVPDERIDGYRVEVLSKSIQIYADGGVCPSVNIFDYEKSCFKTSLWDFISQRLPNLATLVKSKE